MPEGQPDLRASELQNLSPQEVQRRRETIQESADLIQQELTRQQDYSNRVRGVLQSVEQSGDVTADNLARLGVLRTELGLTDQRITSMNEKLRVLDQEMQQLDALLARTQQRELDVLTAEAPIYQTSPTEWNRLMSRTRRVIDAYNNTKDWIEAHPDDKEAIAMMASIESAVTPYGRNIPTNPQQQNFQRNAENERRIGVVLNMLMHVEPLLPEMEKRTLIVDGVKKLGERSLFVPSTSKVTLRIQRQNSSYVSTIDLDSNPSATFTSGTQDLNIRRTQQGWEITLKPTFTGTISIDRNQGRGAQAFAIGEHPAASVGSSTQQVRQTPERVQEVQPTQPRETERTPRPTVTQPAETVRETAEGFSVPADRKIYIRNTQTNQTNYLEPHFQHRQLWLHGYAVARRSDDNRRWTITPTPNQSGDIVYSLDGRTWQRLGQERQTQQQPQPRQPEERRTQPVTPEVPSEQEFITLPDGTKLPKIGKKNSPQPTRTPEPVSEPVVEERTQEPTPTLQTPTRTPTPETTPEKPDVITLPDGTVLPSLRNPGRSRTSENPLPETTKNDPIPEQRIIRETPTQPTQEREQTTPRRVEPTPIQRPREQERKINPLTIRSKELRGKFFELAERYKNGLQKDYASKGGSTEWKVFDHRYHQLQFEIDYCFDGNTPEFLDERAWQNLLSSEDRIAVQNALENTAKLLDEYEAADIPEKKPDTIQHVDTLNGDDGLLLQRIATLRQKIAGIQDKSLRKLFAEKDALFIQAYNNAKSAKLKKAVLICHETFAQNIVEFKPSASPSFGSSLFTTLTSGAQILTSSRDETSFRKGLIDQANQTPMELELDAKQLLQLIKIKQLIDELRTRKDLSEGDRYEELISIIGNNSTVLEFLAKKSEEKLSGTKMLGWKVTPQMKEIFNEETIDWLIAAYLSPEPMKGISDSSFFYLEPVGKNIVLSKPTFKTLEEQEETPAIPDGRELTTEEILALGLFPRDGEIIKEVSKGRYIACGEKTCRDIVPQPQISRPSKPSLDLQLTPEMLQSEPEKQPVAPATPEGISVQKDRREFRLPANEQFVVTYDPPVSGATKAEFGPTMNTSFDGIVIKAERGATEWVVRILPTYEGTVTLRRSRDNATTSLVVQRQSQKKERLAAQPTAQLQVPEHAPTGQVEHIQSEQDFAERVLQSPLPVIVDFSAGWCGHCKRMAPIVQEIARERSTSLRVVEIDADKLQAIFERYAPVDNRGQRSLPTLVVFDNGKVHTSATGFHQKAQIESMIPRSRQIAQNR